MESKLSRYGFVSEVPKNIVVLPNFLIGNFGEDFIEEYNGRVEGDFNSNRNLNVLRYNGDVVNGSNVYCVILANKILNQVRLRTATQKDIEGILESGDLKLRGLYVDTAICLRNSEEPNEYLAKELTKKLGKQKMPVMIPLSSLDLVNDQNSPSGLNFNLRNDSEIIYSPQLVAENNYKKFNKSDENGLPIFDEKGSRTFLSRESGLSRVCLVRGSVLGAVGVDLADSYDVGRVVIVSDEVAAQKIVGGLLK